MIFYTHTHTHISIQTYLCSRQRDMTDAAVKLVKCLSDAGKIHNSNEHLFGFRAATIHLIYIYIKIHTNECCMHIRI